MTFKDYIELNCKVNPLEPWRDILVSELAELGYESFEEITAGFLAFIAVEHFDQSLTISALKALSQDGIPEVEYTFSTLAGKNWNAVWESNFEAVAYGNKCLVRAPFHPTSDAFAMEIVIEPKMSFGTGHHETTSLMAEWILEENMQNKAVLDMGCGTGLLAIIAAKMGATPVVAIDNDPSAYENTMENIIRNNCPEIRVQLGDSSLLGHDTYDVIIANITRNILLQDMAKYVSVLHGDGKLLLSGFFEADKEEMVLNAEKLGLEYLGEKTKKGWLALCFKKKLPY